MKLSQLILTAVMTLSSTSIFAMGVDIGGDAKQTVKSDNIANIGIGKDVVSEQTIASVRGQVKVGGDLTQTVDVKNLANIAIGKGVTGRQTVGSIDSH